MGEETLSVTNEQPGFTLGMTREGVKRWLHEQGGGEDHQ